MARYKPVDRSPRFLPVVLSEQIQPGTFEFALDHLVDHELDLSALDARFNNDETGASAYDPRVMLKIVLLAYSRGLISSRPIESACAQNVQFMALSGDAQPSYTHIAKFVRELGEQIKPLFAQVLATCDRLGLIGRHMFAIDGVKLPANASKERSGTHAELRHRAARLDKAADKIIELHLGLDNDTREVNLDAQRQARVEELRKEAQATRDFAARSAPRRNRKGVELKSNVTDNDSAKMATGKGVIQGYAAQAAVDAPQSRRWWPTARCASATNALPARSATRPRAIRCTTRAQRPSSRVCGCIGLATSASMRTPTAACARVANACTATAAAATSTGASRTSSPARWPGAVAARCDKNACAIPSERRCVRWRCLPRASRAHMRLRN